MDKDQQREWSLTFRRFQSNRERTWQPKVYSVLKQMIRDATNESTISGAIARLDWNITSDKLATVIQNIYIDAGRIFGARAYQLVRNQTRRNVGAEGVKALLPMGQNEELIDEIIQHFRLQLLNRAVFPVTETMKAWILDRLIDAQAQGRSITQVVNDLVAHDFPRNRAFVIARTETLKSANYGAMQGFKKSGYKTDKIWISAHDIRVRRIPRDEFSHTVMDGITIPMDEPFKVPNRNGGFDELMQPGDPSGDAANVIECRCTVGAKILKDAQGRPIRL